MLRDGRLAVAIVLVVLTLAAYWRAIDCKFLTIDDPIYVTKNPHVQEGLTARSISWAFTTTRSANWHPLTWLSHQTDYALFGRRAWGHHLTALLLHAANVLLLFLVLSSMTGSMWRSAFVAALFALHPLHVESVAWVAERKDVLSAFFWMLTMLAYASYIRAPRVVPYLLMVAAFTLGLMAKPMLVTLPLVLLFLDLWPLSGSRGAGPRHPTPNTQHPFLEKTPLFALAFASCVVTYVVQQTGGAVRTAEQYPILVRVGNAIVSYVAYIGKMLWPARLSIFYPHPGALPAWLVISCAVLLAGATYGAIRAAKTRPYLTVGWLWYVVTLIPVIGLVQVGRQAMADRYTYVPLIGIFFAIAWAASDVMRRQASPLASRANRRRAAKSQPTTQPAANPALYVPAGVVLIALFALTWSQVSTWRNTESLFRHAVDVTRDNYVALTNLGEVLNGRGKTDEATECYREALRIQPNSAEAANNLGQMLLKQGDMDEALRYMTVAVRYKPESPEVHFNMGLALAGKNELDKAIEQYREALKLRPSYAEVHDSLAMALDRRGMFDEAMENFASAIRLKPDRAETYNDRGAVLLNHQKLDAALADFQKAIEIKPDLAPAHNNLAAIHYFKRNYAEAWREIELCRQYGAEPSPVLVGLLSKKMTEPGK